MADPTALVAAFGAASNTANAILGDALAPYALFAQQGRTIGTIAVDVPFREVHEDDFVATQFPVETGTPISDHYFRTPSVLEMSVGYSDSTAGYQGYSQVVYQALLALAMTRQPFSVSTGKRYYDSLVFVGISVVTDALTEYVLQLTAKFQEVIITSTGASSSSPQGAAANQAMPSETSPTVDRGTVATTPYFASGTLPSGYTPAAPGSAVGGAGVGGTPFTLTGPAIVK